MRNETRQSDASRQQSLQDDRRQAEANQRNRHGNEIAQRANRKRQSKQMHKQDGK